MKVAPSTFALLLALASCSAPAPERSPRPAPTPRDAGGAQETALAPAAAAALAARSEPLVELELAAALELAEASHPALAAARARVERSAARALQAGRLSDPEAVLRVESAPFEGDTWSEAEYLVGLRQALPLGSRLSGEERVAQAERRHAELELAAARAELGASVRGAFATALYAQHAQAAREALLAVAEGLERLAERRVAAGDSAPREALLASLLASEARHELTRAEALSGEARRALALALGDPARPIASVAGELELASALPALDELLALLARHPLLLSAEAGVEAQAARAELARRERTPDLHLDLLYRRIESTDTDAFDLGVLLPLPLSARGRGRVEEARALLLEERARGALLAQEVEHAARRAHQRVLVARDTLEHVEQEILPRTAELERIAAARLAAGDASLEELLQARERNAQAQLERLEALADTLRAWSTLSAFLPPAPPSPTPTPSSSGAPD